MATNARVAKGIQDQELRDLIVRKVVELGSVCAPNLAVHIEKEISTDELISVLEALVQDGVLRHVQNAKDSRPYKEPYQVRYELAE